MYNWVNVTADSVAALFTFMISVYLRTSSDRNERLNQLFVWVCVWNIGMLIGDIPSWTCVGLAKDWYPLVMWIGCPLLYLSGCLITWVYTLYLHESLSRKIKLRCSVVPVVNVISVINTTLVFVNLWSGKYYSISADNVYSRGEWYLLSQIAPVLILLINAGVIVYHRRMLQMKEILAFLGYLMLLIVAIIFQIKIYGIAFTYIASRIFFIIPYWELNSFAIRILKEHRKRWSTFLII